MRIDLVKYLMIGPNGVRANFFERAQELGIVEFFTDENRFQEKPEEIDTYIHALHILRRRVPVKQIQPQQDARAAISLAQEIVDKNEGLEQALEAKRILEKEISRIAVFGDFSVSDLHKLEKETGRTFQFFFTKQGKEIEALQKGEVIYVGSQYGLDYYFSINKERTSYEGMVEMTIDRSLGDLQAELAEAERNRDAFEAELGVLAHYKKIIHNGLIAEVNSHHLASSMQNVETYFNEGLFAVYGWVPNNKIPLLEKLCQEFDIYLEALAREENEKVPTYLENKGKAQLGEDLVSIYDTPSSMDRDPSPWVFWAFGLFFSMIIGDAGYGIVLLAISLFLFYKFGKKGGLARRIINLSISLSVGCIIWGVLAASFFGISFPPDSKLRSLSLIDWMVKKKAEYVIDKKPELYNELLKHHPEIAGKTEPLPFVMAVKKTDYTIYKEFADNAIMELVILIGTIHIMISFLRYADRNWAAFGWVIFMVGAYLYFPSVLKAVSLIHYVFGVPAVLGAEIGFYLLFGGIIIAFILALIQKKWGGLTEPMLVIQVFADVMSYLRIYALALAGVIMAETFNGIAAKTPLFFGILIIMAGHGVNFVLALMGGLIHGLRLNFIEWYHYSFEGGGKPFNPLALQKLNTE